jgi:hypothetical protein
MRGAIPPLSEYIFMAWCLVKHRDSVTFAVLDVLEYLIVTTFSKKSI